MSKKQNLVLDSPRAFEDASFQQLQNNTETKQIQEYGGNQLIEQISFKKSEGSKADLQEDNHEEGRLELVSIVMIRAESGEKFVFDRQKIPIFTQKINQQQFQQLDDSNGQYYFSTQSLLNHNVLRLFLPVGSHMYLHSGFNNQELISIGKYQAYNKEQIQQTFNNNLHTLPSNKVIVITFKSPNTILDSQNKDKDILKENEEQSLDSQKFIQNMNQEKQQNKSIIINQNKQFQEMGKESELNNDDIKELQQIVRDIHSADSKFMNEEEKRVNERTVKEALQLVRLWRDIHKVANERLAKGMHHISYEKVASLNKLCKKKTLDYFFLELRKAELYGYDFSSNLHYKMGHIRLFNSKMAKLYGDIKERHQKELAYSLPSHDILPVDQQIVNQLLREATPLSSSLGKKKNKTKTHSHDELIIQDNFQSNKKIKYQNQKNQLNSDKAILSSDKVQTACSLGENLQYENNLNNNGELQEEFNYQGLTHKHQKLNEEANCDFKKQGENKHNLFRHCNILLNFIPRDPRAQGRNSTLAFSTDDNFLFLTSHQQTQFRPFNFAKSGGNPIHQQQQYQFDHKENYPQQFLPAHSNDILPRIDENPDYLNEQQFDQFHNLLKPETMSYHENTNNNNQYQPFEASPNLESHNFFRFQPQQYNILKNSLDPSNMDYFQNNHSDFKDEPFSLYSPLNLPVESISQRVKYPDPNCYDFVNQIKQGKHQLRQQPLKPNNQDNNENESCFYNTTKQHNEYDLEDNLHHEINQFDEIIEDFREQLSPLHLQNHLESKEQEQDQQNQYHNS